MLPQPRLGPTYPRGFQAAGVSAGLKASGKLDLGLLVSEVRASCAALFTRNQVKAAPVQWDRQLQKRGYASAVVVNSGQANACTGKKGYADTVRTALEAAVVLGVPAAEVFICSTGVIGQPVRMEKLLPGLSAAARRLSPAGGLVFSRAIMTTDTVPKHAGLSLKINGREVRLAGCIKGSGMIAPNLATMLGFLTTDARMRPAALQAALREVVGDTLNQLTVDGDCSTNDTLVLLANGRSGGPELRPGTAGYRTFVAGLRSLLDYLAEAMAADGEGATKVMHVTVTGARNKTDANLAAKAIANSLLVKCALFGRDPNWGRILCAAGYSGASLNPGKIKLQLAGFRLLANGEPVAFDPKKVSRALAAPKVEVAVDLGMGQARGAAWGCDLSYDYVKINAEYHT